MEGDAAGYQPAGRRAAAGAVLELERVVEAVLDEDPSGFVGPVALERASRLLALSERLQVAVGAALVDAADREAFVHDACGSLRDWLRTQPCGDGGRLGRARRWERRRVIREAVAAGVVGSGGADAVCASLVAIDQLATAVPNAPIDEAQIHGILVHAVPALLGPWLGRGLPPEERTEAHREHGQRLAVVLTEAANATLLGPADRLEPVLTLLAEALPASQLTAGLAALVDALQPERLDAQADELAQSCFLSLTPRKGEPGWDLIGLVDDELAAALLALTGPYLRRAQAADAPPIAALADRESSERESGDQEPAPDLAPDGVHERDRFGRVGRGPSVPQPPVGRLPARSHRDARPVEGEPDRLLQRGPAKTLLDAFRLALQELAAPSAAPPSDRGDPQPSGPQIHLTVLTSRESLCGEPGALPAQLETRKGAVTLAPGVARRLACGNLLASIGLDAHGHPVDTSGEHRHATRAQRRALKAQWGSTCAVNGCTQPGLIPHHVLWFGKGGLTVLANLVPLCPHHHRDVHEGRRTLRLRDGRLLSPDGWIRQLLPRAG